MGLKKNSMQLRKGILDLKLERYGDYVIITNYSYSSPLFGIGAVNNALKSVSADIVSDFVNVILNMSREDINSNVRFYRMQYNKSKNEIDIHNVVNCSKDELPENVAKSLAV